MGIGLGRFLPWENGIQATGSGTKMSKINNGNGIPALRSGISKKQKVGEMGLVTPPPRDPPCTHFMCTENP